MRGAAHAVRAEAGSDAQGKRVGGKYFFELKNYEKLGALVVFPFCLFPPVAQPSLLLCCVVTDCCFLGSLCLLPLSPSVSPLSKI